MRRKAAFFIVKNNINNNSTHPNVSPIGIVFKLTLFQSPVFVKTVFPHQD